LIKTDRKFIEFLKGPLDLGKNPEKVAERVYEPPARLFSMTAR
jgi:hypothetical protein